MKLELTPEVKAGLLAQAHARGLSLEAYLAEVLQDAAGAPSPPANRKGLPHDWNHYLRYRFEEGRRAFERGEAVETDIDEMMDGIEAELGIAR